MCFLAASLEDRVERERSAHDVDDVSARNIKIKERFSHMARYPSMARYFAEMWSYIFDCEGKVVLDYGCGRGRVSLTCLEKGAKKVCGIDISKVYIEDCQSKAKAAGYDEARYEFQVMDAHKLEYPDNTFDTVVGISILHHLEPSIALSEVHRVLKPGGRVIMHEPLGDNPLLKLYRLFTPKARTKDELPFSGAKVKELSEQREWILELKFCGILEAPLAFFTSILIPKNPNNWILRTADWFEVRLNKSKAVSSWNQCVLFNMVKK